MRTIKFRGKDKDTGEWLYGGLLQCGDECYIIVNEHISQGEWGSAYDEIAGTEVDPETVGQFTGILDKNGNEIYEGDTVRIWEQQEAVVRWDNKTISFVYEFNDDEDNMFLDCAVCEVVGNIHDNPELLEDK